MFIAKKAIPRRTVLRGIGAALALPLLDSMVPALSALARTSARPVNRFGVVYVPNGMIMKNYLPVLEGAAYELTPTLSALAPFREQMLVVSGLECIPTPGRPGGAHAKASTRFLTDVSPPTSETWLDAGVSMDQIVAQETGKRTQLASLELAIESGETAGACDTGFACPYTNTISWKSQNTPLPTQNNPRIVFERLFGDSTSTDPSVRLARLRQQRSVLDSVSEEVAKVAKINAYHVQMFARLLQKLQATPDGDGTLLDHVTMMYGAGIADSNSHSPIDIPMILAGGGAGHLKGGRHIRFKNMPLANLHLTLLDQFGVHRDHIGDSTGRVDARILSL